MVPKCEHPKNDDDHRPLLGCELLPNDWMVIGMFPMEIDGIGGKTCKDADRRGDGL